MENITKRVETWPLQIWPSDDREDLLLGVAEIEWQELMGREFPKIVSLDWQTDAKDEKL